MSSIYCDLVKKYPLLISSGFAILAATLPWWLGLCIWILVSLYLCSFRAWLHILFFGFILLSVSVLTTFRDQHRQKMAQLMFAQQGGELIGKMEQDAKGDPDHWSGIVKITNGAYAGTKVYLQADGNLPIQGQTVKTSGFFKKPKQARNYGEFDRAEWLIQHGVLITFCSLPHHTTIISTWYGELSLKLRKRFRESIIDGLAAESHSAKLIQAVVTGYVAPKAEELVEDFRNSGALHLFSVSGAHVAMLGTMIWWVLRRLLPNRRYAIIPLLISIFAYAWLTGSSATAMRSAWMATVILSAFLLRRRPDFLNSLGLVLLVAIYLDEQILHQVGVQLSYLVVASICIGNHLFEGYRVKKSRLKTSYLPSDLMTWKDRYWQKLKLSFMKSSFISITAMIGSSPLTWYHFGMITPISLISSFFFVLPIYILMFLALISASIHPVLRGVSQFINQSNAHVAQCCESLAHAFANTPISTIQASPVPSPSLLLYDLNYSARAACFIGRGGACTLIDAGDRSSFQYQLLPCLKRLNLKPDSILFTKTRSEVLGGGELVWQAFPIKQAYLPQSNSPNPIFKDWVHHAPQAGIRILHGKSHDLLPLDDECSITTLYMPDGSLPDVDGNRNPVYQIHLRKQKILFWGHAGEGVAQKIINLNQALKSDILVLDTEQIHFFPDENWIKTIQPKLILLLKGKKGFWQDSGVLEMWQQSGIHVLSLQDQGGTLIQLNDQNYLEVHPFLGKSYFLN